MPARKLCSALAVVPIAAAIVFVSAPNAAAAAPVFTEASGCGGVVSYPAFGGPHTVTVRAGDPDPLQTVELTAKDLPNWASFSADNGDPATGTITGNPTLFDLIAEILHAVEPEAYTIVAEDTLGEKTNCMHTPIITAFEDFSFE